MGSFPIQGSGGGGGPTPPPFVPSGPTVDNAEFVDEMTWMANGGIDNRYNTLGTIDTADGGDYGVIGVDTGNSVAGTPAELDTLGSWQVDLDSADATFEMSVNLEDNLGEGIYFFGLTEDNIGSATSEADILTAMPNFMGFIFDSAISSNWRFGVSDSGTSTINQSTVPKDTSLNSFKLVYTKSTDTVEFFMKTLGDSALVSIGSITGGNVPSIRQLSILVHISNRTTSRVDMKLDFIKSTCPRIAK